MSTFLTLALAAQLAAAPKPAPKPTPKPAALAPLNHDHDLDYMDDNSRDADLLLRVYAHNSHLQRLLDLGLYQVVFDDDPQGVESFLAAGAHIEGVKDLPLTPLGFATWRNESHTAAVLSRHGAKRVEEAHDQDLLVRQTMDTVTGVQDLLKRELISAEGEYHKQKR